MLRFSYLTSQSLDNKKLVGGVNINIKLQFNASLVKMPDVGGHHQLVAGSLGTVGLTRGYNFDVGRRMLGE